MSHIQVLKLTYRPNSAPNQNDMGNGKTTILGNTVRNTISSQCLNAAIDRIIQEQDPSWEGVNSRYIPAMVGKIVREKRPESTDRFISECYQIVKLLYGDEVEKPSQTFLKDYAKKAGLSADEVPPEKAEMALNEQLKVANLIPMLELEIIAEWIIENVKSDDEIIKFKNSFVKKEKANKDDPKDDPKESKTLKPSPAAVKKASKEIKERLKKDVVFHKLMSRGEMYTDQLHDSISGYCDTAFSYSVNRNANDYDFFSRRDNLKSMFSDEPGGSMIDSRDINSSLFFEVSFFDINKAISNYRKHTNLSDAEIKEALNHYVTLMIKAFIAVDPDTKQHSNLNHSYPEFIGIRVMDNPETSIPVFGDAIGGNNMTAKAIDHIFTTIFDGPFANPEEEMYAMIPPHNQIKEKWEGKFTPIKYHGNDIENIVSDVTERSIKCVL